MVLPGHCVSDVAARMPRTRTELADVPGFGAFRVERYGDAILGLTKPASN